MELRTSRRLTPTRLSRHRRHPWFDRPAASDASRFIAATASSLPNRVPEQGSTYKELLSALPQGLPHQPWLGSRTLTRWTGLAFLFLGGLERGRALWYKMLAPHAPDRPSQEPTASRINPGGRFYSHPIFWIDQVSLWTVAGVGIEPTTFGL